jgi:hypothetical protein
MWTYMDHCCSDNGGKQTYWAETSPTANLFSKNPKPTGLELNPHLRDERPATNRLSHGRALYFSKDW